MTQVNVERKKFLTYLLSPTIEVIRNTCGIFSIVSIPNIEQVSSLFVLSTACFLQLILLLLRKSHYYPIFVMSAFAWGPPQTLITQRNAPASEHPIIFTTNEKARSISPRLTHISSEAERSVIYMYFSAPWEQLSWRVAGNVRLVWGCQDLIVDRERTLPTKPWQLRTVWEAAPSSQLATNSLAAEERSASAATFRLSVQFQFSRCTD